MILKSHSGYIFLKVYCEIMFFSCMNHFCSWNDVRFPNVKLPPTEQSYCHQSKAADSFCRLLLLYDSLLSLYDRPLTAQRTGKWNRKEDREKTMCYQQIKWTAFTLRQSQRIQHWDSEEAVLWYSGLRMVWIFAQVHHWVSNRGECFLKSACYCCYIRISMLLSDVNNYFCCIGFIGPLNIPTMFMFSV